MLNLDIHHNGKSLSLELPMNTNMLTGELRAIGIHEPLEQIHRSEYLLSPANELGEHFLRIVKPEDNLRDIALACREPEVLAGESLEDLVDLIMADRFRGLDHMADYLQYGPDALDGLIRLTRDGRSVILPSTQINMYHCFGAQTPMGLTRVAEMEVQPVSEFGRQLIAELQPYSDTVATLNEACSLAWGGRDITATPTQIMKNARMFEMPMETEIMNFYCPMFLKKEADEEGELLREADSGELACHEALIRDALAECDDMMEYLPEELQPKIASVRWDAERIGPALYGCVHCELRAPLSEQEYSALTEWITHENADGYFRDFEQEPFETDFGNLYVGFWREHEDCYLLPEGEFRAQVLEQSDAGQALGGMGGMS